MKFRTKVFRKCLFSEMKKTEQNFIDIQINSIFAKFLKE
jgi:hypothetical protein